MNIRPLHDRIVVKPIETSDSTVGGLFIPDSAKEKPHEGRVVAISRGKRLEDGTYVRWMWRWVITFFMANTLAAKSSWQARLFDCA